MTTPNVPPDRLESIAADRGTDPDIRFLLDEILRLRDEVDYEHGVALELGELMLRRLDSIATDVTALVEHARNRRR